MCVSGIQLLEPECIQINSRMLIMGAELIQDLAIQTDTLYLKKKNYLFENHRRKRSFHSPVSCKCQGRGRPASRIRSFVAKLDQKWNSHATNWHLYGGCQQCHWGQWLYPLCHIIGPLLAPYCFPPCECCFIYVSACL